MIGRLRGLLAASQDGGSCVDVGGVGYEVAVSTRGLAELPPSATKRSSTPTCTSARTRWRSTDSRPPTSATSSGSCSGSRGSVRSWRSPCWGPCRPTSSDGRCCRGRRHADARPRDREADGPEADSGAASAARASRRGVRGLGHSLAEVREALEGLGYGRGDPGCPAPMLDGSPRRGAAQGVPSGLGKRAADHEGRGTARSAAEPEEGLRGGPAARDDGRVRRPDGAQGTALDPRRGRTGPGRVGRPPAVLRAARPRQDDPRRHPRRRDGGPLPRQRRARHSSVPGTWPPSSPTSSTATCSSSTRSTACRAGRGGPLPGHGGLPTRHRGRQGSGRPLDPARPSAFHADRRNDPGRSGRSTAAGPLRVRRPARLLRPIELAAIVRRSAADPRRAGSTDDGARPSPSAAAARPGSPTACCGGCATTPRCEPTASSTSETATALAVFEVDEDGLDKVDRAILEAVIASSAGARSACRHWRSPWGRNPRPSRTPTSPTCSRRASSSARRGAGSPPPGPTSTWASRYPRPGPSRTRCSTEAFATIGGHGKSRVPGTMWSPHPRIEDVTRHFSIAVLAIAVIAGSAGAPRWRTAAAGRRFVAPPTLTGIMLPEPFCECGCVPEPCPVWRSAPPTTSSGGGTGRPLPARRKRHAPARAD